MNTVRFDDPLGGQAYPFLPAEWAWQIVSQPLAPATAEGANPLSAEKEPTLRWVKDDKVLDLEVPGMDTAQFLVQTGLQLSMHKGAFVLSKRLSRIMRPYRYWGFLPANEVTIDYNEHLDPRLWDGCGQVSRRFVERLADRQMATEPGLSQAQHRELLNTRRFEVTTLHAGGQDKGHVIVVDDLAVDFMFPAGSAKTELSLTGGRVFVGLQPVHSEDQMCLDIQSLINLYPFFRPEQLLAWAEMESALFLDAIRSGRLAQLLNRIYTSIGTLQAVEEAETDVSAEPAQAQDALASWHVGEYIASGGNLMWFAGMVKAVAKQHLKRLGSRASKMRFPVPGGRYYIFPAAVGARVVPAGHVELDPACATAWVNDEDWLDHIVAVLGGCDGDDAVWVLPFRDGSAASAGENRPVKDVVSARESSHRVLLWRSPNQLGEYLVLKPTAASHTICWDTLAGPLSFPKMESRLLPPRIDSVRYQYGILGESSDLATVSTVVSTSYSIGALTSTISRAAANRGVLGAFCNVTMLCKAIYGRLPAQLPATLEAIIDGSVKSVLDLAPVKRWNEMALTRMVLHGQRNAERALPAALLDRLPEWLRPQANIAERHWLDTLARAMEQHQAQYWADVEALATEACPPLALFEHGREWLAVGKELRQTYSHVMRQSVADEALFADDALMVRDEAASYGADFEAARAASENFLAGWPVEKQPYVLLGAAAYLYAQGPKLACAEAGPGEWGRGEPVRDGLLWQLGEPLQSEPEQSGAPQAGRLPGIAQQMVQALRDVGLLGEPVCTRVGSVLYVAEAPCPRTAGVPVRINGVWLNWLNSRPGRGYARMGDVPPAERELAKARIADLAQTEFPAMVLSTEVVEDAAGRLRVITRTPQGNLFGYVQRDHELAAIRLGHWRIAWATTDDGNVLAVLEPAGC